MEAENYFESTMRLDAVLAELLIDLEARASDRRVAA